MLQNQCTVSGLAKGIKGMWASTYPRPIGPLIPIGPLRLWSIYIPLLIKGGSPAVDPSVDLCREVDNISRTVTQGEGRSWPSTSMGAPPGGMQVPPHRVVSYIGQDMQV